MGSGSEDSQREAKQLPTGRLARTARVGGLVTGQGVRWASTRAANRVRSPERAAAAERERTTALVNELVDQLGRMRGAAMKVGQMISMVEFDGLPEEQERELRERLATLRDGVPPVPFSKLQKLLREELGGPLARSFAEFDEQAFAAASIGQVHRATTLDGHDVVVKVQYPGIAEAVDTDLRNAMLLVPLLRRLAPGLDGRALASELRERITEELDYELEAQNQRRIERLMRGHPLIHVPHVYTELSTRRVLVSEYVDGERFEAVRLLGEQQRDRYAETVFRFFFGLLYRDRIALGDPHPGNYLRRADGRVSFLDFGLLREVSGARVAAEARIAMAVRTGDADELKQALTAGGYLPPARAAAVDAELALRLMRRATSWYAIAGRHRFAEGEHGGDPHAVLAEDEPPAATHAAAAEHAPPQREGPGAAAAIDAQQQEARRARVREQVNQFTVPAEAVLIRRMHGVVAAVMQSLRAGADWGAIAGEYLHGEPPATEQGELEAEFLAARRA